MTLLLPTVKIFVVSLKLQLPLMLTIERLSSKKIKLLTPVQKKFKSNSTAPEKVKKTVKDK